jgi:hypothetical protein
MEDARKEGGRWFCSPSCLLQGSPGRWKNEKRSGAVGTVRRIVKWTLIIVGLLVVALIIGAIVGLGGSTKPSASGKQTAVVGAPPMPRRGDRSHPVPLGRPMRLARQWRLTVRSMQRNADAVVTRYVDPKLGVKANGPPSPGAQYVTVAVALEYVGGGSTSITNVEPRIHVIGKHNAAYSNYCIPPHEINGSGLDETVFSGHTLRGNLCFEVAQNDARTLRLYVDPLNYPTRGRRVWFALRG